MRLNTPRTTLLSRENLLALNQIGGTLVMRSRAGYGFFGKNVK